MTTRGSRIELVSWLALIVALLALFVAAVAFNQTATLTNQDMSSLVRDQLQLSGERTALTNAKTRLEQLRIDISEGKPGINPQSEIDLVREDLRTSYGNFSEQAKLSWQSLDDELDEVQDNLEDGAVTIVAAIDQMIEKVQLNIEKTIKTK